MTDLQWAIGGEAGYGIMTTGMMTAKIFTRLGLSVFDYVEYPSLIRGGHNVYYVRGSDEQIFSQKQPIDILVALNRETIDRHKKELSPTAAVLYDPNVTKVEAGEFNQGVL
ncbi:MAG TPA: 2-oxoacid:acceptor oxidoreductase family protein, partial [Candidatus Saccharimonadales bacterium]|nr:2-oxoacid:acceptor oxidoreductase family protein [Candidatus Saccharimonadales bacterium]